MIDREPVAPLAWAPTGRVIAVDYLPFNATRTLQKFFQEHTRIAVVLLALALAVLSYSVLDPIRVFFIKARAVQDAACRCCRDSGCSSPSNSNNLSALYSSSHGVLIFPVAVPHQPPVQHHRGATGGHGHSVHQHLRAPLFGGQDAQPHPGCPRPLLDLAPS